MIPTDEPTPCVGNWMPFDVLIDARSHSPGWAIAEVGRMCGACPVRDACWTENREEPWVKAIRKRPTQERPECGTVNGARAHHRRKEQTCAPCRAAEAERSRQRKAAADARKAAA